MSARIRAIVVLATLLVAGVWAGFGVRLDSDLARFMPAPDSADERLLVGEIGRGPASRLLLLAIAGDDPDTVVAASRALRIALVGDPRYELVLNGELDELQELARLLPLRYSHSPGMDAAGFDADALADVLDERLADLGSLGGDVFETLLAHDPHALTVDLAQALQPPAAPPGRDGVWFSDDGEALLLVQTHAAGFDPQAQVQALAGVDEAFATLANSDALRLTVSGAGSFSARMSERVRSEATWLAGLASAALVVILLLAYRSPWFVLACALPLLAAAVAGLIALRLGFDSVHGITLAFAFTLIGVAQDYPVHLLSHRHPGTAAADSARRLWPALRLGVASTVVAYLSLFSAQAEGLAQLAVFTITGLLTAALVTRFVLPTLLPPARRDVLDGRRFRAFAEKLTRLRAGVWPVLAVLVLAGLAVFAGRALPWWNHDLASLTPLPTQWLVEDQRLREALATPDARHVLVLSADDRESLLQLSERLQPGLDALVQDGTLAGHGLPSTYLPSRAVQEQRLARLPTPEALQAAMIDAAGRTGFDADYFAPMIDDVRALAADGASSRLEQAFEDSPIGARVQAMLRAHDGRIHALVELTGIADLTALERVVAAEPGARVLDLKASAEAMVSAFRIRVLHGLAIAAALLAAVLALALGPGRMLRVLPPVLLGLVATVSILRLLGVELGLFHLIALMLAAGLGLDYALFFQHAQPGSALLRTTHAVLLSVISTALVFGLLATSTIPVLYAIGSTVAIGVGCQFVLALLLARAPERESVHAGT